MTALEKLRRRRKPLARIVVLLVSWVWLSASATPCLGMVTEPGGQAHGTASHSGHADHDLDDNRGAPAGHDGHCPHCPDQSGHRKGSSPAHIGCATADDLSNDNTRPKWQPSKVKHAPFMPAVSSLQAAVLPGTPRAVRANALSRASPRPLNLRFCIFLN